MNSFFGGTQGASFIIVKRFDAVSVPKNTVPRYGYFPCNSNKDIYVYLDPLDNVYKPILRNEINKYFYDYWHCHAQNGSQINNIMIDGEEGDHSDHTEVRVCKLVTPDSTGLSPTDFQEKIKNQTFAPVYEIDERGVKVVKTTDLPEGVLVYYPLVYCEGMVECFKEGGTTNQEVGFGEYVLIDSSSYLNNIDDPDNGKIYRRGLDYQLRPDNPLAGAEYVGRVIGAPGQCTETFIDSLDAFRRLPQAISKEYLLNNIIMKEVAFTEVEVDPTPSSALPEMIYHNTKNNTWWRGAERIDNTNSLYSLMYESEKDNFKQQGYLNSLIYIEETNLLWQPLIDDVNKDKQIYDDLLPGKYTDGGLIGYNDAIQYGWVTLKDELGKITGCRIGFKFPYHVLEWESYSVDPYYHRDDLDPEGKPIHRPDFINTHLIDRKDDGTHLFYQKYRINVPRGIHGEGVLAMEDRQEQYVNINPYKLRLVSDKWKVGLLADMPDDNEYKYYFAIDWRYWYIRENDAWRIWDEKLDFNDIKPLELTSQDVGEIYTQDEIPYNIYEVVEVNDNILTPRFYPTIFMENETNPDYESQQFDLTDVTVEYRITDILKNKYIQIDIDSVPYWCHYDEDIIDNCYNQSRCTIQYQHFNRGAAGEKYWLDFGPTVIFKELNLTSDGRLDIRFANRRDYHQQIHWVDKVDIINQRDIIYYFCDGTIAHTYEDALQKMEYIYIQTEADSLTQYVDKEVISLDKIKSVTVFDDTTKEENVVYYLSQTFDIYEKGYYTYAADENKWISKNVENLFAYTINADNTLRWFKNDFVDYEWDHEWEPINTEDINHAPLVTEGKYVGNMYATETLEYGQTIKFRIVEQSPIQGKEGTGDQKVHMAFNDGRGDMPMGAPINYVMETAVLQPNRGIEGEHGPAYHMLVLYSDPHLRNLLKDSSIVYKSEKFNELRDDWCDLGYVRGELASLRIVGTIEDPSILQNGIPPEVMFNDVAYTGWGVVCANKVYTYDYLTGAWFFVWDFTNTIPTEKTVYVDEIYGDDDSDGSYIHPYQSIRKAIDNQFCMKLNVYLKGLRDYTKQYSFEEKRWMSYPSLDKLHYIEGVEFARVETNATATLIPCEFETINVGDDKPLNGAFLCELSAEGIPSWYKFNNLTKEWIALLVEDSEDIGYKQLRDIEDIPATITPEYSGYYYATLVNSDEYVLKYITRNPSIQRWYRYVNDEFVVFNDMEEVISTPTPNVNTVDKYYFLNNKLYLGIETEVNSLDDVDPVYVLNNYNTKTFMYEELVFMNNTNNPLYLENVVFNNLSIYLNENSVSKQICLNGNVVLSRTKFGKANNLIHIGGVISNTVLETNVSLNESSIFVESIEPNYRGTAESSIGETTAFVLDKSKIRMNMGLLLTDNLITYTLNNYSDLTTNERIIIEANSPIYSHDSTSCIYTSCSKKMMQTVTQTEYDNITTKDPDVAYIITYDPLLDP